MWLLRFCSVRDRHNIQVTKGRSRGGSEDIADMELKAGMVIRHHSGRVYSVLHIANTHGKDLSRFPATVVYRGANGHVKPKLTDHQITRARHDLARGESCRAVARDLNVHHSTISRLR